jgi:predicted DNA-binding protein (MmcQ/YjbR family)
MPEIARIAVLKADLMARPGVTEERPFGPGVLVYKVMGKMFALTSAHAPVGISLKCDPHLAEILREQYAGITAGYHLNKRHWNSVAFGADVPEAEIIRLIGHSYDLVRASLTRKQKVELEGWGA